MSKKTSTTPMNGSVNLLANAMRDVFQDCMTATRMAVKEDMDAMEGRLSERIDSVDDQIQTTNENMQSQFSQQEKKIAKIGQDVTGLKNDVTDLKDSVRSGARA